MVRLGIEAISEEVVADCALNNFIRDINLELWVTPATKIPIIKITIDNSIRENAFLRFIILKLNNLLKKIKLNYKKYF
jgi:hypothetical protein